MKLKKHAQGIVNFQTWYACRPPKKGKIQWVEGRSAMELAKYITTALPQVPKEIEESLGKLLSSDAVFDWDAEYVTALPETGEGRNHDAILYNDDIVVTIEAKADETLGGLVKEEIQKASVNKLRRISKLLDYLFRDGFKEYQDLRYQLMTASVGTLLEAEKKRLDTAVLLVVVFKTDKTDAEKLAANHKDIDVFLKATNSYDENGFKVIPNNTNVKLYFKEIII